MNLVKHSTMLISRTDTTKSIEISVLGTTTLFDFTEEFNCVFKEDIRNGKISIQSNDGLSGPAIITIKGSFLWDNVPVTRVTLYFNAVGVLNNMSADILSFGGISSVSDCIKTLPHICSFPKVLKEEIPFASNNILNVSLSLHYVNAEEKIFVTKDNTITMSLYFQNDFLRLYNNKFNDVLSTNGDTIPAYEGLPVLIKGPTKYCLTGISCDVFEQSCYVEKIDENIYKYRHPAFLVANNNFYPINYVEFIKDERTKENKSVIIKLAKKAFEPGISASDFSKIILSSVHEPAIFGIKYEVTLENNEHIVITNKFLL